MDKYNKKVMYEYLLINKSFWNELEKTGDNEYGRYYQNNTDWYNSFGSRFNNILGYTGQTEEDFISFISSIDITPEQRKAISELRKEPMYKKLVGETALQQKSELEEVLGSKINNEGYTFADEVAPRIAYKTEDQLEKELDDYSDKLSQLLSDGSITEEQYNKYDQNLDYIYTYYFSQSKGEQVPFRRLTNAQYEQIEQRAMENGVSFYEQLRNENEDLMYTHEELQELQAQHEENGMHM